MLQHGSGDTLTYRIRRDAGVTPPYRIVEEVRKADGSIIEDDSTRCATRDEAEAQVVHLVSRAQSDLGYKGTRGPAVRAAAASASTDPQSAPAAAIRQGQPTPPHEPDSGMELQAR